MQKFALCISDKRFKYLVNKLLKLRQYEILCCTCGNYNIALICHIYTYINTRARTHTHTHTHTHTRTYIHAKFKFFYENIRSNKDSGQTERNKLKYFHYLNKMIENCKMKKFIFSEVSCFQPELFQRFCLDFKWLYSSSGIQ